MAEPVPVEPIEVRLVVRAGGERPADLHRRTSFSHDFGLNELLGHVAVVDFEGFLSALDLGSRRERR